MRAESTPRIPTDARVATGRHARRALYRRPRSERGGVCWRFAAGPREAPVTRVPFCVHDPLAWRGVWRTVAPWQPWRGEDHAETRVHLRERVALPVPWVPCWRDCDGYGVPCWSFCDEGAVCGCCDDLCPGDMECSAPVACSTCEGTGYVPCRGSAHAVAEDGAAPGGAA